MTELFTTLTPGGLIKIGLGLGIFAMLCLGDGAVLPVGKWLVEGSKKLIPKGGGKTSGPSPEDDCLAALQCLMNHALRAGDQPLLGKLLEVVEPVHKLHEKQHTS